MNAIFNNMPIMPNSGTYEEKSFLSASHECWMPASVFCTESCKN